MPLRRASLGLDARAAVSGLLCLSLATSSFAQQARPKETAGSAAGGTMTLRTTVRRVVLDVVVSDAQGKPVPGLQLSDFSIKEDGKPQHPLSFDVHGFDEKMDYTPAPLPAEPANTFINLPATPESGPLYVLLYDLVNTELADQIFARQQLVKFIHEKPAGARYAIFVFSDGLHLVQGFTSDQQQLFAAIDPKRSRSHVPMIFLMGNNFGQGDPKTMQEVFSTLGRYLDGLPGRKNIIWLSGAFPLSLFASPEEVESYQDKTRQMLDLLARDQISVYPVSARGVIDHMENAPSQATSASGGGVTTDSRDARNTASSGLGSGPGSPAAAASASTGAGYSTIFANQMAMDEVASVTGGRAFYGRNDVHVALAEATESGSSFYTLSYAPTNTNYNGKLRSINVQLAKRGYTLSYRRAYYGTDPNAPATHSESIAVAGVEQPEARRPGDSLAAMMEHGAPTAHDLVFATHLHALNSPALGTPEQMDRLSRQQALTGGRKRSAPKPLAPVKLQTFAVDYAVIARQFAVPGLAAPPSIEIAVAAYDADGRILNAVVNKTVEDAGATATDPATQKKLYKLEQRIDVPVDAVSLRVAMRDMRTDRIGALEVPLPLAPETQAAAAPPNVPAQP
ncbi:MAG TPA: VWA domain-containing protein [Acidobacteriaceae bacterium]